MKKLEELKISPAPWECTWGTDGFGHYVKIIDGTNDRSRPVVKIHRNNDYDVNCWNAIFIRAAPKLYKALYELVEAYEACNAHDGTCGNCERRKMCQQDEERIIASAKSALAEAAGERGEDK